MCAWCDLLKKVGGGRGVLWIAKHARAFALRRPELKIGAPSDRFLNQCVRLEEYSIGHW